METVKKIWGLVKEGLAIGLVMSVALFLFTAALVGLNAALVAVLPASMLV